MDGENADQIPYVMVILIILVILVVLLVCLSLAFGLSIAYLERRDNLVADNVSTIEDPEKVIDHELPNTARAVSPITVKRTETRVKSAVASTSRVDDWHWTRTSSGVTKTTSWESLSITDYSGIWHKKKTRPSNEGLSIVDITSDDSSGGSVYSITDKFPLTPRDMQGQGSTPSLAGSIENVARYSRMDSRVQTIPDDPHIPLRLRQITVPYVPLVADIQHEALLANLGSIQTSNVNSQSTFGGFGGAQTQSQTTFGGYSSTDLMGRTLSPHGVSTQDRALPPVGEPEKVYGYGATHGGAYVGGASGEHDATTDDGALEEGAPVKPAGIKMVDTTRLKGRDLTIEELLEVEEIRNKNRQQTRHRKREERRERRKSSKLESSTTVTESVPIQVSEEISSRTITSPKVHKSLKDTAQYTSIDEVPDLPEDSPERKSSSSLRRATYPVLPTTA